MFICSAGASYLWIDNIPSVKQQGYGEGGSHSVHSTPPSYMYEFLIAQPSFMLNKLYYIYKIRFMCHYIYLLYIYIFYCRAP